MQVSYEWTADDMQLASRYLTRRGSVTRRSSRLMLFTLVGAVVAGFLLSLAVIKLMDVVLPANGHQRPALASSVIVFSLPVSIIGAVWLWARFWKARYYRRLGDAGALGTLPMTVTVEVTDEGLRV